MATSQLPCLVLDYGDKRPTALYSVVPGGGGGGAYRPCEIDALLRYRNWVTARGWVLGWDPATAATFLWDPRAPEDGRIALPSLPRPAPSADSACALSGDPTGPGGFTVVVVEPPEDSVLWYCHVGSSAAAPEWVRHEYDLGGSWATFGGKRCWIQRHITRIAACRGKFYYPLTAHKYGMLEFSPEPAFSAVKAKGVKLIFPPDEEAVQASVFLLDLDGRLHAVMIFFAGLDVSKVADVAVYRLGFAGARSVRVDSIGDRAILATSNCTFAAGVVSGQGVRAAAQQRVLDEQVYKCLHVYDIRKKTEQVQEPCEGVAELSRLPFWLIPDEYLGETPSGYSERRAALGSARPPRAPKSAIETKVE